MNIKYVTRGFILNDTKEVMILQRTDGLWNLPGGKMEKSDKLPEKSIGRELKEELGINVNSSELIYEDRKLVNTTIWFNLYFRVTSYDGVFTLNTKESLGLKWVKLSELSDYSFAFDNDKYIRKFFSERLGSKRN